MTITTKLKEPVKTHEGCRFCHGGGVETEFDPDWGKSIILSDPCFHCGGDGYDRVETEEELNAAADRFSEDNMRMWESMQLIECSNVIDS